jgi:hyperosmotically inducible protein
MFEEPKTMTITNRRNLILASAIALMVPVGAWAQGKPVSGNGQANIEREVHHELVTLSFYTVFDNLEYKVDGTTVTLLGQVTRPVLKSDTESAVKEIEGVKHVINDIEVLPLSPNDDRIRIAEYHAIYGTPGLDRYSMRAVPTIHIIVKNGHVVLEGAVGNEMDRTLAGIKANGVPGVFSVKNNLRVDKT